MYGDAAAWVTTTPFEPKQSLPTQAEGFHYQPIKPFKIMDFKKGAAYTGLCDVWGGKMWFCVIPDGQDRNHFCTKNIPRQ